MRFKLLCIFIALKVAFVITLQYLAIKISDTRWAPWHFNPYSRGRKVALLIAGLSSGQLEPSHQLLDRAGSGEGIFGTEVNVERGETYS